jgi:suppressor of fused
MADVERDPEPLGWNAIDQALESVYGAIEPLGHYAARLHAMLGGDDYIQGISVYFRETPVSHYHYVTYGFTELYEKEWKDPQLSGFGFELTFRLKKYEDEPPTWPILLLQNLGRYVYRSGNGFDEGHYFDCQGKIAIEEETDLCALLFAFDPEIKAIDSPNGRVQFLQIIGITKDEHDLIRRWNAQRFLEGFAARVPLLLTDLYRESVLTDPIVAAEFDEKAKAEGSSSGALFVSESHFSADGNKLRVIFGANAVTQIKELLFPRLGFARPLHVQSKEAAVIFAPGDVAAWKTLDKDVVQVVIPANIVEVFNNLLQPKAGIYRLTQIPDVEFEVRRSEIKDAQGKTVQVIG